MGTVIIALRGSDHTRLEHLAAERGMSTKDMAGVLLEQAIRAERLAEQATHSKDWGIDPEHARLMSEGLDRQPTGRV